MNFVEKKHSHHQFISASGGSNRPKFTTRHLAALDFLLNIPMANEATIRQNGNASRLKSIEDNDGGDLDQNMLNPETPIQKAVIDDYIGSQNDAAGKKLDGPSAVSVRYPQQIRFVLQRNTEQSAIVRQWEDQYLVNGYDNSSSQSILSSRMFCSRARSYPSMIFSVIKYDAGEEKAKIDKLKAEDQKGMEVFEVPQRDWRGFSYKPYFKPISEEREGDYFYERGYLYDPNFIDDPAMLHGSHRYVLQSGVATGPVMCSIILFVNEQELKKSLNEQFRERHPQLPPSLTLSRIRNLKKKILIYCKSIGIEISTVALGIINFERLCMKNLVTKANRRLSMAVSLILAVKFNETTNSTQHYHKVLSLLLEYFDHEWDLSRKQVFDAEFGAYVHLGFVLHIPAAHIYLVYSRLLKLLNMSSKQYLGETMNEIYMQDVLYVELQKEAMKAAAMMNNMENNNNNNNSNDNNNGEDNENNGNENQGGDEQNDNTSGGNNNDNNAGLDSTHEGVVTDNSTNNNNNSNSSKLKKHSSITKILRQKDPFGMKRLSFFENRKTGTAVVEDSVASTVTSDNNMSTGNSNDVNSNVVDNNGNNNVSNGNNILKSSLIKQDSSTADYVATTTTATTPATSTSIVKVRDRSSSYAIAANNSTTTSSIATNEIESSVINNNNSNINSSNTSNVIQHDIMNADNTVDDNDIIRSSTSSGKLKTSSFYTKTGLKGLSKQLKKLPSIQTRFTTTNSTGNANGNNNHNHNNNSNNAISPTSGSGSSINNNVFLEEGQQDPVDI